MPHLYYRTIAAVGGFMMICAPLFAAAATEAEIRAEIQERARRLEAVNQELQLTQNQLFTVQGEKNTLQKQIQSLDSSIKQLNLNIEKGRLTSANLQAEIVDLQDDMQDIDLQIGTKKQAVVASLQALQQQDNTSFVMLLLASPSLAAGLADAHALGDLRSQLNADIASLSDLSDRYRSTLEQVSAKNQSVVIERKNLENRREIVEDQQEERAALLKETQSEEALYQQRLQELKAQQEALDREIAEIEAKLRAQVDPNALPVRQEGLFSWPLSSVFITQHFGEVSSLYRGRGHNGLDLRAAVGTPVMAVADGTVTAVGNNDVSATRRYQYGRYVLVRHGNNLSTLYAHLSRQAASPGQQVRRGEIIGYSGNTGYSTGPHLHLGVYFTPSVQMRSIPPAAGLVPVGATLRPESYLPAY